MTSAPHNPEGPAGVRRIGVVVHPTRELEKPLSALREWAAEHGVELVQIDVPGNQREVGGRGRPEDCDLIVSIGGDGTMLAATRASLGARRPVLGVACGSLGALTGVAAGGMASALDRFARQDWVPRRLPGLEVGLANGAELLALNDIAIVRAGQGQIRATATVDQSLYARFAGDGCIVSTAVGSSAYSFAAGGPLLAPGADAYLLTPLTPHGGVCPPLVIGAASRLQLDTSVGYGGGRIELDGQVTELEVGEMRIGLRRDVATVVAFPDGEALITRLRRRKIIIDSPRILAEDGRA
jgi:NAD+ kinase